MAEGVGGPTFESWVPPAPLWRLRLARLWLPEKTPGSPGWSCGRITGASPRPPLLCLLSPPSLSQGSLTAFRGRDHMLGAAARPPVTQGATTVPGPAAASVGPDGQHGASDHSFSTQDLLLTACWALRRERCVLFPLHPMALTLPPRKESLV